MFGRLKLLAASLVLSFAVLTNAFAQSEAQPGIFVFGGTRNTGLEIVKLLLARNENVTVLVRETSDTAALNALGANLVVGDALDPASLDAALAAGSYRATITTLSGRGGPDDDLIDGVANINAAAATKKAGIKRLLMISTIGTGDTYDAVPWYISWFILKNVIIEKDKAEQFIFATDLDYTVIRPGGLTDDPATGKGIKTEDVTVMGWISRAEVARLMVESLYDDATIGKAYSAIEEE
jgi:uncharacterized protein YbjT (DUF2867 family)